MWCDYCVLLRHVSHMFSEILVKHSRLKEDDAARKFSQMVQGMHYCHEKGVVHRDIKAENLLLDYNGNIKIAGKFIYF